MDDNALATAASRLSNELHLQLGARPTGRIMLLLDPALRPITEGDALAEGYDALPQGHIHFARSGIDPLYRPYLLELDAFTGAGSDYLGRSVRDALAELQPDALKTGAGRRIGGWLASDAPMAKVAHHLSSVMIQHLEDGNPLWLRLHDPAVLWWVWRLLEPAQQHTLLGPIDTFWLLDPAGRLVALRRMHDEKPIESAIFLSLGLSAQQWQDIAHIEPLNMALRKWGNASALPPERFEPLCMAARNALRRARTHGFDDRLDLAAYARCVLEVHPSFDLHPHVRERIEAREEGDYFTGLVDDFEEDDWQRIARECEARIISSSSGQAAP